MIEELFRNPILLWVLLIVVLLLFGGSRVADVGGSLGKSIRDFKKSLKDDEEPAATVAPIFNAAPPPASRACANCGTPNAIAARFCISCGNAVSIPNSATPAS